jgi:DNA-binding transcriptional LysR family regulator
MELRHLRYFVAVAEELHFGHAASRLHTSQPSLSQQIRNLERELKVQLLVRTKRRVVLSPAGHRFLNEAREILAKADRAVGLARGADREEALRLVIAIYPETDWRLLGRALRLFAEHVPSVEIYFENLTPEAQVEALHAGLIDLGFVALPIEAEGLASESTGRVRLMVALPEEHPMARKATLRLKDLSEEAYTLWPRHFSPASYDQLLSVFRRAGFGPPISMAGDLPSTQTVLGMIAAGLTIALVDPALRQMAAPGVVFRDLAGQGVFIETGIIYRQDDSSPILASFLQELRATIRRHGSAPAAAPRESKKAPRRRKTAGLIRRAAGRRESSGRS